MEDPNLLDANVEDYDVRPFQYEAEAPIERKEPSLRNSAIDEKEDHVNFPLRPRDCTAVLLKRFRDLCEIAERSGLRLINACEQADTTCEGKLSPANLIKVSMRIIHTSIGLSQESSWKTDIMDLVGIFRKTKSLGTNPVDYYLFCDWIYGGKANIANPKTAAKNAIEALKNLSPFGIMEAIKKRAHDTIMSMEAFLDFLRESPINALEIEESTSATFAGVVLTSMGHKIRNVGDGISAVEIGGGLLQLKGLEKKQAECWQAALFGSTLYEGLVHADLMKMLPFDTNGDGTVQCKDFHDFVQEKLFPQRICRRFDVVC